MATTTVPTWIQNGYTTGMAAVEFRRSLDAAEPVWFTSFMTPAMARTWRAFILACWAETGQTLAPVSRGDVFRSYQAQYALFMQRYEQVSLAVYLVTGTSRRKRWDGRWWRLRPGMAMAATPGSSNHGNGLAIDAGWIVDGNVVSITSNVWAHAWVKANAASFFLHFPVKSEAWHAEKFNGDAVSDRVQGIELFLGLAPITPANFAQAA